MRVRRRSSADHLVFQRDPIAHLNRPPAPSPLSFPPTTEEEEMTHTPTSSHFVRSPITSPSSSFPPVETPAPAHIQAHRSLGHSRAASLGETQTLSRSSSRRSRNAVASPGSETPPTKSHRSHAPLSLGSIFGRGSHPESPVHDEGHPESPQSNGRERGREKNSTKRHSFFPHYALGRMGALGLEDEHKEVGDGWQEFRKGPSLSRILMTVSLSRQIGTYTFPISFEIPAHMPASLDCDGGSVTWRLVAKVRRPGVFSSKLTATREVQVISIPAEADVDMTGDVLIERSWDDQLQYFFQISGKVFAIGSSFNIKMSFMPLAKIQIYKLAIDLEERVDSYVSGMNMTRTVTNAIPILSLQPDDETKPLLPLSVDDPLAYERSPLAALQPLGTSGSEVVSQLLGPGPWPIRANLHLPADCGVLHSTSRSKDSSIHVTHALRLTMRLTRGDDPHVDPRTGKRKLFEVVVRTSVHILSCYARAEYTALPRYSETLDEGTTLVQPTLTCPCAAERERREREGTRLGVESSPVLPTAFGGVPNELLERTLAYERLVSGNESVLGDAPPAYDAGPDHALRPAAVVYV
ncbi:hypothetical protein B0F90DRAFT_1683622 [Multifurca ochricompacta]|uniref:Arrestin C-terminal-like domain-containing protein n=1 Tax=Multifurca ochricompacta TaxID=376703 RepID=A0AAD4QS93_9AGAM|nr:hypothetical protein B0F90DRAFT_1683622 [Multifurca ochricompacta]